MSSDYRDRSTWYQATAGGIRYRTVDHIGTVEQAAWSVNETLLVHKDDLLDFVVESFPTPRVINGIPIYNNRKLPGLGRTNLFTRRITYKGHVSGKPIDPFGAHLSSAGAEAPGEPYQDIIEVTVEYDNKIKWQDPDDPKSFLEIRASVAGEFLQLEPPEETKDDADEEATPESYQKPTIGATFLVPEVEWTITIHQMPDEFFRNTYIKVLRSRMGKVNNDVIGTLYNSEPRTLLFCGWEQEDEPSPNTPIQQPIRLDLKLLQKRVEDRSSGTLQIRGHNHVFNEGRWRYVVTGNGSFPDGTAKSIYEGVAFKPMLFETNPEDAIEDEEE